MSDATDAATPAGEYVVVARRYRPQTFDELIGQQHVAGALQQAIRTGRIGHAYLFTGARGVGKTSAARILAKALNCEQGPTPTPCCQCDVCQRVASGDDVDVLEIDGASNRGIDEIRQLRQNAGVRPSRVRFKVYIIDEVHMLTKEAFNALLKTLEEPPEHVKFIFATTEPQKIPITILSRCQRFDFAGVDSGAIGERLRQIAEAEGVAIDEEALQILSVRAAGSMRDSQSLLEQLLAVADGQITAEHVNRLLGIAPAARVADLAERLADRDAATGLALLDAAVRSGADPGQVLDQLMGYYRDVMAVAVGCPAEQMLNALPAQFDAAKALGERLGVNTLLAAMQVLDQASARMRVSVHERTLADMAVVRLASLEDLDDLAQAVADLRATPAGSGARAAGGSVAAVKKNVERPVAAAAPQAAPTPTPATAIQPPTPPTPAASTQSTPPGTPSNGLTTSSPPVAPPHITVAAASPPVATGPSTNGPGPTATVATNAASAAATTPPASSDPNSMMAQFAASLQQSATASASAPPTSRRANRRQQQTEIAQNPFVARAIELFGVEPEKLRYTPPRGS